MQVRVSIGFKSRFHFLNKLELWLVLRTLKAIADSSDSCVATSLELFYLVVSSALER